MLDGIARRSYSGPDSADGVLDRGLDARHTGCPCCTTRGQAILDLGQSFVDVCGVWAAEKLLSAWASQSASSTSVDHRNFLMRQDVQGKAAGEENAESPRAAARSRFCERTLWPADYAARANRV